MLIILMYHQIHQPQTPSRLEAFVDHLKELRHRFNVVVPGDKLPWNKLSICLTFDDAYADFYFKIFPQLVTLECPAVLGIPTAKLAPRPTLDSESRLSVHYPAGLAAGNSQALCTWQEIATMVRSGYVVPASHSLTHANLTDPATSVQQELIDSKAQLEANLGQPIDTFIYPFGRMTPAIQQACQRHYRYAMRIGAALNHRWQPLLYRFDADALWQQRQSIGGRLCLQGWLKYWLNRVRGR